MVDTVHVPVLAPRVVEPNDESMLTLEPAVTVKSPGFVNATLVVAPFTTSSDRADSVIVPAANRVILPVNADMVEFPVLAVAANVPSTVKEPVIVGDVCKTNAPVPVDGVMVPENMALFNVGDSSVGEEDRTTESVPVDVVDPVPPLRTGSGVPE